MATEVIPHRSQVLGLWSSQCFPKCWHPGTRSVGAETISQDSSHPQLDKPEKIPSRLLGPLFQHQRYSNPPTLVQRFWIFHSTPRSSFPSGSQDLSTHSLKGNPLRLVFGGGGVHCAVAGTPRKGRLENLLRVPIPVTHLERYAGFYLRGAEITRGPACANITLSKATSSLPLGPPLGAPTLQQGQSTGPAPNGCFSQAPPLDIVRCVIEPALLIGQFLKLHPWPRSYGMGPCAKRAAFNRPLPQAPPRGRLPPWSPGDVRGSVQSAEAALLELPQRAVLWTPHSPPC